MNITDAGPGAKVALSQESTNIFGNAATIQEAEIGPSGAKAIRGLALSGGGIRSASFAMGVVQATLGELAGSDSAPGKGSLGNEFDYMSTVSGGGYLGGAITWLQYLERDLHREMDSKNAGVRNRKKKNWLDYVRQHGEYLQPRQVGQLSLISVVLRNALVSLLVYFSAAVLIFFLAISSNFLPDYRADFNYQLLTAPGLAMFLTSMYLALVFLYPAATFIGSFEPTSFRSTNRSYVQPVLGVIWIVGYCAAGFVIFEMSDFSRVYQGVVTLDLLLTRDSLAVLVYVIAFCASLFALYTVIRNGSDTETIPKENYRARLFLQQRAGLLLGLTISLAILSLLPIAHHYLTALGEGGGLLASLGSLGVSGALSSLGILGSVYQFTIGRSSSASSSLSSKARILLTATALILGLLFGAYASAKANVDLISTNLSWFLVSVALLGLLVNLNYFGIARMYRDRLMETFMPNSLTIDDSEWRRADSADSTSITVFDDVRPFHIVNTNVVLVDSDKDFYRGRGGDSFVITPKHAGSEATGYTKTESWLNNRMNLPTAIAISGAAVNPNSGVAGSGITRNRLVSFLLSLLQLRIGYWAPNVRYSQDFETNPPMSFRLRKLLTVFLRPNYWIPGIGQGLFGRGLRADAAWIELTDGGHFDNTGVYELVRREVDEIFLSLASADPEHSRADIANLARKIRVDFGAHLLIDEEEFRKAMPHDDTGLAAQGFVRGKIQYCSGTIAKIIIFLATPCVGMTPELISYHKENPSFPNEPTSDQFYDEQQLEAYRELGFLAASSFYATRNQGQSVVGHSP